MGGASEVSGQGSALQELWLGAPALLSTQGHEREARLDGEQTTQPRKEKDEPWGWGRFLKLVGSFAGRCLGLEEWGGKPFGLGRSNG